MTFLIIELIIKLNIQSKQVFLVQYAKIGRETNTLLNLQ